MKKLISSILALSLVAGMSVTAFATAGDLNGFGATSANISGSDTTGYDKEFTVNIPISALKLQVDDGAVAPATAAPRDATSAEAKAIVDSGAISVANSSPFNVTFVSSSIVGSNIAVKLRTATSTVASGNATNAYSITIDLSLTSVAGLGTPITAFAANITGNIAGIASGVKIDDVVNGTGDPIGDNAGVWTTGMAGGNVINGGANDLSNLDIRPDADIKLYLDSSDFRWIDSNDVVTPVAAHSKVTTSQLRTGKITVKKSVSKGSNVIETVEFDSDSRSAYVKIEFVEWFVSVNEQDVDFTIYLAHKGSKRSDTEVTIAGTMENEQDEVDEGDDYISTEDGTVFEAQDYVRNCEVYLGNGVYLTTNLFKDKKYYGIALNTYDTTDGAIMDEYPEIDNVLTLKTVNLKGSGNIVHFDMTGDYYVYGADGTYLGLSSEKVPYSDKYYFATERISITGTDADDDDDVILDEDDDDDYVGPSDGGGDDANNANDNPGTGVNGFVGVAVAAGLISLAAVGVTARKKK